MSASEIFELRLKYSPVLCLALCPGKPEPVLVNLLSEAQIY